ncbi:AGCS family alanine or glycine:cation symporter [Trueperella bonasi]|uniref:AGCS family alanine or glycine:cation symporter n=1 Tax=Trueperella bonasi TaxID=312286 RepID=A0ABT9NHU3_9ACTO|nr:alanine/glycine:cation symporter family protein [Trueperella bonasi]MDP9806593.1 AGCS family alanine or glycine:cation symporter [Trueperella bonasi]
MEQIQQWLDSATGPLTGFLGGISDWLYTWIMLAVLTGTGIYLTFRSKGLQLRHFGTMTRYIVQSRKGSRGGISSFQAFAIGMATRIGIGNITGVALAMILGGPGALFWMWVVATFGMATAFAEATLAQIFKKRHPDGTFRGGPATYILRGLKSRPLAVAFAVAMVFSMTVAMPMVQSNAIAGVLANSHGVEPWVTGLVVAVLTGVVVVGGVRGVARATEVISPVMAIAYLITALAVIVLNIGALPGFFADVFMSAFGLREALAGTAGGIIAALVNGMRRGLFSNEAGMGTNPNAAATATVSHPVQQGLIQSFGVFLDTMLVCTATGFIIMTSGVLDLSTVTPDDSGVLTTVGVIDTLGGWMAWPMSIMIFFFGFSSILGAYAYGEANLVFLNASRTVHMAARVLQVVFSFVGAVLALTFVWTLMDLAMFVITILNLVGVLSLSGWVLAALKDYERQIAAIKGEGYVEVIGSDGAVRRYVTPVFVPDSAGLPGDLGGDAWTEAAASGQLADPS